ncbi:Primary amine oxidase precursor [Cedecea neteri]|uniref:Primary amine oxidase n=1 Tax=Cedecea neteri TaxID=158822 RepID=A0A2X3J202_9ENTR|nr:Primary amine oxidase precursor [Cedecea neteri]
MMAATGRPPTSSRWISFEPEGKNYTITGDTIHWQNWDLHLRLNSRVGPIISHRDLQRQRHQTEDHV